ncbi:MAG: cellulase family glycosylhydrolase [Bacteroidales bacterium]|nr:cellulase family glycosylhydrolase [Bacteroidales bacterium]
MKRKPSVKIYPVKYKIMHHNRLLNIFWLSFFIFIFHIAAIQICAQSPSKNAGNVYVDNKGVMRWEKTKSEVTGFGINYTVPFAHALRVAKQLGISPEKAIDEDVYHFARLGFDLYRVHVWDCEISDSAGNLLTNEHLRLFDYMLNAMKKRGMKFVLTPIAYTNSGYPEPGTPTSGFSTYFGGKANCLINPEAIKAQENYLFQFMNHVNSNTGMAYKDDPDIIAFEICNEPHHKGTEEETTAFINQLAKAIRRSGCKKPIFYNMSHSVHLADAYINADVQGGTFQWYPAGLVGNVNLQGNFLPHVDNYPIPFAENNKFKKMAKLVYELDAADIGASYIYPAMARSFRKAGIQTATQFAWDPNFIAYANTSYRTHYMNLAYAPQKALSLKIAFEVFHMIPMYSDFGPYPQNTTFGPFSVDYENDLAELVSDKKFMYTNSTQSIPPAPDLLEQIAGYGISPVIQYEGFGAYFLDRLENGIWRLEVMPDAICISDPFDMASLKKEVTIINWKKWRMMVNLPDLGENFSIQGLNDGNAFSSNAIGNSFSISPGSYLLVRNGFEPKFNKNDPWKNIRLNEFVAPPSSLKKTIVLHTSAEEVTSGNSIQIEAKIIAQVDPESVELCLYGRKFEPDIFTMTNKTGYTYSVTIPAEFVQEGFLHYYISVKQNGLYTSYPSGFNGFPTDWDFYDDQAYHLRAVPPSSPIYLFDAIYDIDEVRRHWSTHYWTRKWVENSHLVPSKVQGKAELYLNIEHLFTEDPENLNAVKIYDCTFRHYMGDKIAARKSELANVKHLVFTGHALNNKNCKLQVALVLKNGSAFGEIITVKPEYGEYSVNMEDLKPVKLVLLPRPYPTFLPYYFEYYSNEKFNPENIESLQFSIGPGIPEDELLNTHGIAIESVRLE